MPGKIKRLFRWATQDRNYYGVEQMNCPEIVIVGIEQPMYDKLLAEANAAGAVFNGAKVAFKGCEFDWDYDAEAQVLHITCTNRPWYYKCDTIADHIRHLAERAKVSI